MRFDGQRENLTASVGKYYDNEIMKWISEPGSMSEYISEGSIWYRCRHSYASTPLMSVIGLQPELSCTAT